MKLSMYDRFGLAATRTIEKTNDALKEVFKIEKYRDEKDKIILVIVYGNDGRKVFSVSR